MERRQNALLYLLVIYCLVLTWQVFYITWDYANLTEYVMYVERQNNSITTKNAMLEYKFREGARYYKQLLDNNGG